MLTRTPMALVKYTNTNCRYDGDAVSVWLDKMTDTGSSRGSRPAEEEVAAPTAASGTAEDAMETD